MPTAQLSRDMQILELESLCLNYCLFRIGIGIGSFQLFNKERDLPTFFTIFVFVIESCLKSVNLYNRTSYFWQFWLQGSDYFFICLSFKYTFFRWHILTSLGRDIILHSRLGSSDMITRYWIFLFVIECHLKYELTTCIQQVGDKPAFPIFN